MAVAVADLSASPPPPLKWAGGKRWLLPHLWQFWDGNQHRRLVEPFVGGLAVALGLKPRMALLSDVNPHLISFYKWLQTGLDPSTTGVLFQNDRQIFGRNRDRFNELIAAGEQSTAEAAVLFYYLNRTCFNGLCRFNANGFFNVPFGTYKKVPYRADFDQYVDALRGYELVCCDFQGLVTRRSDFVYADPPYDVEFTTYSAGGFSWDDQIRLADWLADHRGPVVVSNQATRRILGLYRERGFRVRVLSAPRRISCDGNRDDAREMLATLNI